MSPYWRRIGLKIAGVMVVIILSGFLCKWVLPLYLPGIPGVLYGPLSLDEVLKLQWLSPLFRPDLNTPYTSLGITYYYTVSLAEKELFTYFTIEDGEGRAARVAKMENFINTRIRYNLSVSEQEVPIQWALEGKGWVCEVPEGHSDYDSILGSPYQSCLYWVEDEQFVLYSIWPQDEAIKFVNSLVNIREREKGEP